MKQVLIVGANGKVGRILCEKLKDASGYMPVALVRKEEQQAFFDSQEITSRAGSIENSTDDIAALMKEIDIVVFTAGSGGKTGYDKTLTVDLDGAVKCMDAAGKCGIRRFVMVSALNADKRPGWAASGIAPYYVAKHYADRLLKKSGLDYTIVRPGRLLDSPGKGKINIKDPEKEQGVPREDVASVIIETLDHDNTIGKIIEFNEGERPIEEAVAAV
ncbi:SDR family oxidoreductase [Sinomicrobium soli]|uniref:SDR family oxidoreductase n=1 Tax=Sinomicrobium sp. N-1-3-6 TaxID=2219864 RepID=UPI000DCDF20D|nr:SDR family oxidoreductase [Sinomicrobium sp. N-1-3-6]RAV28753.1 SDR family NAD(P)-dependent oxidoreductase [Sinomicrobium sp. N-1-3-6]